MSDDSSETTYLEDDGAGYLISVSDIMAGLLFIFLITLVAFVINFQAATDVQVDRTQAAEEARARALAEKDEAEKQRDAAKREQERLEAVRDDLTNARRLRRQLLVDIQKRLQARGIRVEIDHDHGVLRLTENAISFESGRADLTDSERAKLPHIAAVLMEVVPCYAAAPPEGCEPGTRGKLDAVFVEGHTDNVPLTSGRFRDNWDLSAQRAMYTYRVLAGYEPGLPVLQNGAEQPLFSVSGYGEGRPVVKHLERAADALNRRIDLRFIMSPPLVMDEPEPIRLLREHGVR